MDDVQFYELPEEMKLEILINMDVEDLVYLVNSQPKLNYLIQEAAYLIVKKIDPPTVEQPYNFDNPKFTNVTWLQILYCVGINIRRLTRVIQIDDENMFECVYNYNSEYLRNVSLTIIKMLFKYGATRITSHIFFDDNMILNVINGGNADIGNYFGTITRDNIKQGLVYALISVHDEIESENIIKVAIVISVADPDPDLYLSETRIQEIYTKYTDMNDFNLMVRVVGLTTSQSLTLYRNILLNQYDYIIDQDQKLQYLHDINPGYRFQGGDLIYLRQLRDSGNVSDVHKRIIDIYSL